VAYCPVCNAEIDDDASDCYVCGRERDKAGAAKWLTIGEIEDKLSSDFAKEVLASYEIPVVIFSRSGFFGNIGLPLNPFYKSGSALFEVSVPEEFGEEARDILQATLGTKWHGKES
jgi:hypothetical protein